MLTQLVQHERIRTTHRKCLALRAFADRVVAYGKKAILAKNTGKKIYWERKIQGVLTTSETREKLVNLIAQRFKLGKNKKYLKFLSKEIHQEASPEL